VSINKLKREREVIVYQTLVIDPLNQAREDRPSLVDRFNGASSTDRATNNRSVLLSLLLLLSRHQATTKSTCRVFALVFFTEHCAPVIHQVFTHKRFAAVGATGCYPLAKTFRVIGLILVHVKTGIDYRFMASGTKEVIRVPVSI
jgi:hypothetical protein